MQQKTTYTYKIAGELEIQADIYRGVGTGPQPAILWFHGGALIMGSREKLPAPGLFARLIQAGYTVVSADYRLAPETQLAEIVQDVEDVHTWLLDQGPGLFQIDAARVAIMGMSAGGYLSLTAASRARRKPQAVVSFYGYGDITGPWYTSPSAFYSENYAPVSRDQGYKAVEGPTVSGVPDNQPLEGRPSFYLYCRQNGLWPLGVSGHDPAAEPGWFRQYEPLRSVTPAFPPTMLLHGERDTDVPFAQSVLMAEAFAQNGVPHEFISSPEWGHVFDHETEDAAISAAFDQVMRFLNRRLRGE